LRFVQDRIKDGLLDARIKFVFSNREPGEAEGSDQFFRLVGDYGLPLLNLSSSKFRRARGGRFADLRDDYDQEVMDLLDPYKPDICVLAGYMLIVGGTMCRRYSLLNLHPALPDGPTGTWQEVVWRLIESRASKTGAMVHMATEEVDRGPVISYCTVPLTGEGFDHHWQALAETDLERVKESLGEEFELFQAIRQAGYRREPYLVFETLKAVAEGRVAIRDGKVLKKKGPAGELVSSPEGLCLDPEVLRAMYT
jgi:folate-dependent phosphoribosylglycinamide formyltransferase PurN